MATQNLFGNNLSLFGNLNAQGGANIAGVATVGGSSMVAATLPGSGSVNIPAPGFYLVPVTGSAGLDFFTGTLPNPASFPGGEVVLTDTLGIYPYLLTGTVSMLTASTIVGVGHAASVNGTKLTVAQGGTVGLMSDTKGWLVFMLSGSATIA